MASPSSDSVGIYTERMARTDELIASLAEIQRRWVYNLVYPNVSHTGERRRDDVPWQGLIVIGDFGPVEGHECFLYGAEEGCVKDGHDACQFVGWIDYMGRMHYAEGLPVVVSDRTPDTK